MSNEEFHEKSVAVLVDIQQIHEHAAALVYSRDSERISFHLGWIKWYLKRFNESFAAIDDLEF